MKIRALCALAAFSVCLSACAENFNKSVLETQEAPAVSDAAAEEESPSEEQTEELAFSMESGFYDSDITLEIICKDKDAKIYYTIDGSVPDENSTLYSEPLILKDRTPEKNVLSAQTGVKGDGDYIPQKNVDKANVIRAIAVYPDGSAGDVVSKTYFIGTDRVKKYGNVPIISLFTDPDNLFDYEKGIYILGKAYDDWIAEDPSNKYLEGWQTKGNYSGKGREWERPVTVEYFTADGVSAFTQDMGIRVMGAASRGSMQKSFRLTARSDYGKKSVEYEVIPDNLRSDGKGNVTKYKSFVLRNGGNDCDFAKIRDPYLQSLVSDRRFETQQRVCCVVYIDGEYWGMYSLNEDYSDNYIENNYGIDNNNVIVIKRGEIEDGHEDDIALYDDMYDFIVENDMTVPENYKKASEMLDMGSFADYLAFNLFINNEDSIFKNNNWEMWRVRDTSSDSEVTDGRWRMLVYDTEYSTGIYDGGTSAAKDNFREAMSERLDFNGGDAEKHPKLMFLSLYENEDFRREFVTSLCDIRNINFRDQRAVKQLLDMSKDYKKLVPDTFRRFGPDWVAYQGNLETYYNMKINEIAKFMAERYEVFPYLIQDALSLGREKTWKLSVSDKDKGAVYINASRIPIEEDFEGMYFDACVLSLKAVPKEGGRFVRWEYEGCTVSDENSADITVSFEGDFSLKAIFE